jgi:hypothetical protein
MIIGVAIKNDNGLMISLPKPNRHSDCFFYAESIGIDFRISEIGIKAKNQGFVTHTGKYLDREQSSEYLKKIKQKTLVPIGKIVISEDLW